MKITSNHILRPGVTWKNGYAFGVVSVLLGTKCIYSRVVRIARQCKQDALSDADNFIKDARHHGSLIV